MGKIVRAEIEQWFARPGDALSPHFP
jgi:hypothetical protein